MEMLNYRPTVLLSAPGAIGVGLQSMIADRCKLIVRSDSMDSSQLDRDIEENGIEGAILANQYVDRTVRRVTTRLEQTGMPYLLATASCHQAHLMFELSARDYVLLSMPSDQIQSALSRFIASLVKRGTQAEAAVNEGPEEDVIWVKNGYADRKIHVGNIRSISADKDYAILEMGASSLLVRRTMSSLAEELDPDRFIRIHRSHIVPISAIREIRTPAPNRHELELECGTVFPVGRTYWRSLRELLRRPVAQDRAARVS
ncbi:MAG: DNA-binding response regulator [Hyphobacterium sp.]|nr:MAG: DNA-binding response regulator [Hyphobacterium sp.]